MRDVPWIPRFWVDDARFWVLRSAARCFSDDLAFPTVAAIDARLAPRAGVRFELQPPRPRRRRRLDRDALYDARIAREGVVPTRASNWHDFLNALVWATFPAAKRALHTRQHRAISARVDGDATRLPGARTRELDALAILDEGGAILVCDATRDGPREARVQRVIVFGHAIYENFVCEGPAITARSFVLEAATPETDDEALIAWADGELARALARDDTFGEPAAMPHWEFSA